MFASAIDFNIVINVNFGRFFIIMRPVIVVTTCMGLSIEAAGWTIRCHLCRACPSGTRGATLIRMIRVAYYLRHPMPDWARSAKLHQSRHFSVALLGFGTTRMNETCQWGHLDLQLGSSTEIGLALSAVGLRSGCLRFLTGIRPISINFELIH